MRPRVNMRLWLPYSELAGTPRLIKDEFRKNLLKFPRSGVLIAISRLSTVFGFGPIANTVASDDLTAQWVPRLFPRIFVDRVLAYARQGRVIFFQGQLRYLASEVMRLPKTDSENETYFPDALLGPMLLCAAEMLYTPPPEESAGLDKMASLIAMFLPIYEIDSLNEPFMLFTRFYAYLTICIPRLPPALRIMDPALEFEKVFHFSLRRYYLAIFTLMMHAVMQRDAASSGGTFGESVTRRWWKNTNLTESQADELFASVSVSLADLPDPKTPFGFADFDFLRDRPYFRRNNELYCLDYEFAVAKLESGVIWRVRNHLDETEKSKYFSFWGNVFEEYVVWLFEEYCIKQKNTFYRPAKNPDGTQLCDALVVCGAVAVVIEIKLATCASAVRYSNDHNKMRRFLERDLVVGNENKLGAVMQLQKTIRTIASGRSGLPDVLSKVDTLIPLIITRDDIGSSWMTNGYLNARFEETVNRKELKPYSVTPLVSMSVATLERGLSALSRWSLAEILQQRIRNDDAMQKPFEAASRYLSRGTWRVGKHLAMLEDLIEHMEEEFKMSEHETLG